MKNLFKFILLFVAILSTASAYDHFEKTKILSVKFNKDIEIAAGASYTNIPGSANCYLRHGKKEAKSVLSANREFLSNQEGAIYYSTTSARYIAFLPIKGLTLSTSIACKMGRTQPLIMFTEITVQEFQRELGSAVTLIVSKARELE